MRLTLIVLVFSLVGLSCGGEGSAPEEIQHSTLGTWKGTTAGGVSVEMQITSEAGGCCSRSASGNGRIVTADADTFHAVVQGLNQTDRVLLNFGGGGEPMFGQFFGEFANAGRLDGVMIGPEVFGNPPVGPFGVDSVPIQLQRE